MKQITIPRLVIAGTHSGVGKTTITAGLIRALRQRGMKVQAYKVGPDYIDPGYHNIASGRPVHNLDTWLMPAEDMLSMFQKTSQDADIAIIEGVMGLFDGGRQGQSSTAQIAKLLAAPVVLVTDIKSVGQSIAATILGYKLYDPELELAGVILNRAGSSRHEELVREAAAPLDIPVVGCVYRDSSLVIAERHLGLTPTAENGQLENFIAAMGDTMVSAIAIDKIKAVADNAKPVVLKPRYGQSINGKAVKIGVAKDEAFSFYYPESLETLERLGAELVSFSPLRSTQLPDVDGLLFGGGFPEMFVEQLAANKSMLQAIKRVCQAGMPVYAECGGLMYLTEQIIDFEGTVYPMASVVPAVCRMQNKLQAVGYVEAEAINHQAVCNCGEKLKGHEFHFSTMEPTINEANFPWAFEFTKMRTGAKYRGGYAADNVTASYLHMHFAGNRLAAERFINNCQLFAQARQINS